MIVGHNKINEASPLLEEGGEDGWQSESWLAQMFSECTAQGSVHNPSPTPHNHPKSAERQMSVLIILTHDCC